MENINRCLRFRRKGTSKVYLLGAEDHGIPEEFMQGHQKVFIDTSLCLNVAVAGSIIIYDRQTKIYDEKILSRLHKNP